MQHKNHGSHHEHAHHEPGFWGKYVFSTDHKIIGIQYAITALIFLFFGFSLMMVMRWQLAYPGKAIPLVGSLLHNMLGDAAPGTVDATGNITDAGSSTFDFHQANRVYNATVNRQVNSYRYDAG